MPETFSHIHIKDIDFEDDRFKVSLSSQDTARLAGSIKQTGQICPVLLKPTNTTYIVITGFNRVIAHIEAGMSKISAMIVAEDTPESQCCLKAVAAVAFRRTLTPAERILSVSRLSQYFDPGSMADLSERVFNEQLNPGFIKDLLSVAALPEPSLHLIEEGKLAFKSAKRLTDFPTETIRVFLDLFSCIKASASKQNEIITFIKEISALRGADPAEIYREGWIQNILTDRDQPPGVKADTLRRLLYENRFPSIVLKQQQVQKEISGLNLDRHIKFIPPENFEGPNYTLSFTAKNSDEFKDRLEKINTAFTQDNLKKIFDS